MIPFVVKRKKSNEKYQFELEKLTQSIEIKQQELDIVIQAINNSKRAEKEQIEEISQRIQQLQSAEDEINKNIFYNQQKERELFSKVSELRATKNEIECNIENDQRLAKQSVQAVYDTAYENMTKQLDDLSEKFSQKYEDCANEYNQEYENMLSDYTGVFLKLSSELQEQLQQAKDELAQERKIVNCAIEANKREDEKRLSTNKYKIFIQSADMAEIKRLKDLIPYMRNSRPISKIIWEVYFRSPTNDLISRVLGPGTHCGIYKLTNLLDHKIYIGQSVDIAERWKQHIKCGLGIDTPQNNKLYKAMLTDGVENFSFELLEECDRASLNAQEIYWIDFYKSQDYGYNMTKGGS